MSETVPTENPLLTPHLRRIHDAFINVFKVRSCFVEHSALDYRPDSGEAGKEIAALIREYNSAQKKLLSEIDSYEKAVLQAGVSTGKSISTAVVQRFAPFKVAIAIVADTGIANHYYSVVASEDKENIKSPIHDVVAVVDINGKSWRTLEVALDVLQFWDLFLRYQTILECRDFCRWVRKSLQAASPRRYLMKALREAFPKNNRFRPKVSELSRL